MGYPSSFSFWDNLFRATSQSSAQVYCSMVHPASQCGFHTNRGIIDMIIIARQLQEKCQAQHLDLYLFF